MSRFAAFDLLVTMVAVVSPTGSVLFANAALEEALGVSRRVVVGKPIQACFADDAAIQTALDGLAINEYAALRCDATLRVPNGDSVSVHVIVAQTEWPDCVVVEMLPLKQHSKQDREERSFDQTAANKELVRNLAHEIKNPLGGIRGAAQLLQMEVQSRELMEYAQVIIHEADRLQALVDRLLAPHRTPRVVVDVNIHEVCERVRSLMLVEYPRGLTVQRDYDASIPEFRGDREQLIQVLLNVAQNAALALQDRIETGDGRIIFRTRVARQITFGKQRHKLALELHVIDNGPGIADDIKERIFYPLVSGRDGGSGLGLTLAQTFVHQHLGVMEFESVPGLTDFKILIPLP